MDNYDTFNREERNICAHFFRLLHETKPNKGDLPIQQLINLIDKNKENYNFNNKETKIFCEVAIIRDFYCKLKPNVSDFMDKLTQIIMQQENIHSDCRVFSELPDELKNTSQTHPKQIKQKAIKDGIQLSKNELSVYGAIQGMFNAKPDMAITYGDTLYSIEAKFTESFDIEQLSRTKNIADVWVSLLFNQFGFQTKPHYKIIKLGAKKFNPDINWSQILEIAKNTYDENDRTYKAINEGVKLLKDKGME